ncbi:MAG: aminotransferase class I/II-fold pyridoxal phosphate-dependent enzyme [Hyphomicrobiales bacterium]
MNPGSIPGEASSILQDLAVATAQRNGPANMQHGGEPPYINGSDKDSWLDLSTGINPTPYPIPTLSNTDWQTLPLKRDLEALLLAARVAYDIPKKIEVMAGPGTEALIWQLPNIIVGSANIIGPTYSSHSASWSHWNSVPTSISSNEPWPTHKHLVLVNPNNPTGNFINADKLISFAKKLNPGCILVIDEAFMDCTPELSVIPHLSPDLPILVLRSFGKFFGLAGLRLGFAVGPPNLIRQLNARFGDWSVSGPALQIGKQALDDHKWQGLMRDHLQGRMNQLYGFLKRPDTVLGRTNLFLLYQHQQAKRLHNFLARQKIWTRIFLDQPDWIRFGVPGSIKDFSRLAQGFYDFYESERETP